MAEVQPAATAKEARDVAEAARQAEWKSPSFLRELFLGRLRLDLIDPFPAGDPREDERAEPFLHQLRAFLERLDSDAIDREGRIPDAVIDELRAMGAFGIRIPREYGGLGLSLTAYLRAMELTASRDGNVAALLSAHQSIGLPQPLVLFGTEAQKKRYLPRLAAGAISAFALTEEGAGSDPANLRTTATPSADGSHYVLNGKKIWCTNATRAELVVVMARTPDRMMDGKLRKQITAFIVETGAPGVQVGPRSTFMGLRALENGVLRLEGVKVPAEDVLWDEGKGLKLALVTLNTGRLTVPASCVGAARSLLRAAREWARDRVQWGAPVGRHEANAVKLGQMSAGVFAMEAVAELAGGLAERGADIRLEAAVAKLFTTELGWQIADDALQIRGGRGYETADSLKARGERPVAVERALRDFRVNRIFEGSSEILRLFIAREAVDQHLATAFDIVNPDASVGERLSALERSARFYPFWYASTFVPPRISFEEFGALAEHVKYAEESARRLARALFHGMLLLGPALEKRQMALFRAVDIGAQLFAMAAVCSRARALAQDGAVALADAFCLGARARVEQLFGALFTHADEKLCAVAEATLSGRYSWLDEGAVGLGPPHGKEAAP